MFWPYVPAKRESISSEYMMHTCRGITIQKRGVLSFDWFTVNYQYFAPTKRNSDTHRTDSVKKEFPTPVPFDLGVKSKKGDGTK